jgi:peptidyl-tRNA hydrolase
MISANQLYKQSKTSLTFKEWLKETQEKGVLQNHEKMYNLIESESEMPTINKTIKKTTSQDAKTKLGMVNILGFVGLALVIYGLTRTSAE